MAFLTGKIPIRKKREEKAEEREMARKRPFEKQEGDMEQVMVVMLSSPDHPTTTCPTWKLYQNPFFNSHYNNQQDHHLHHHYHHQSCNCQANLKHLHQLSLPLSARKIAASFRDFTFFRPIMETELDFSRAQIMELKSELEFERKARKKAETVNKRLAKELVEERRGREAVERVCEKLAREVSLDKAEIGRIKRETEEERKMLRMAEVLREERVQMKLAEAKFLFEERLSELEEQRIDQEDDQEYAATFSSLFLNEKWCGDESSCAESKRVVLSEKSADNTNDNVSSSSAVSSVTTRTVVQQRKGSPETENPHIKRGIKGFVEFPSVVRAIGSKSTSSRHWGTKVECQKAQLRILLKQKSPIRSNNLKI